MSPAEQSNEMSDQSLNATFESKDELRDSLANTPDTLLSHCTSSATTRNHQVYSQEIAQPTKCLYVQPWFGLHNDPHEILYREIYVHHDTAGDFLHSLAKKCNMSRYQIVEVSRMSTYGDRLCFDDSAVEEVAGEQDMVAKFEEIEAPSTLWPLLPSANALCYVNGGEGKVHPMSKHYKVQLIY
jgi:hypothetical protein